MKSAICFAAVLALQCGMAGAQTSGANPLESSRVFIYEDLAVKKAPTGAEGRSVVAGTLATGESVAVHETMQPVGIAPSTLHKIQHSEVIVVQQGTVEFQHDGKAERVGPGGVIYVALGTMHSLKNVGDVPAKYVVVQIGGDTKQ